MNTINMDVQTQNQVIGLIESMEKLIKVQNDTIVAKEEYIQLLKKYIKVQELEKDAEIQRILMPCLN